MAQLVRAPVSYQEYEQLIIQTAACDPEIASSNLAGDIFLYVGRAIRRRISLIIFIFIFIFLISGFPNPTGFLASRSPHMPVRCEVSDFPFLFLLSMENCDIDPRHEN